MPGNGNAKRFLKHEGVAVYHVYRDDMPGQADDYCFATSWSDRREDYFTFDVRELRNWKPCTRPEYLSNQRRQKRERLEREWEAWHAEKRLAKHVARVITEAIELGYVQMIASGGSARSPYIECTDITGEVANFRVVLNSTDTEWPSKMKAFLSEFGSPESRPTRRAPLERARATAPAG